MEFIVNSILNEGRLSDVKKRHPKIKPQIIDYLSKNDPSGNNKYLEWMVRSLEHEQTVDKLREPNRTDDDFTYIADKILDIVHRFHNVQDYLVSREEDGSFVGTKDLYAYKFSDNDVLNHLHYDVIRAEIKKQEKEEEKESKKEVDKIYEDGNWTVVLPKTHRSSCYYGAGTKWCTTTRDSDTHFKTQTHNKYLIYVINKKGTGILNKVAWQIPRVKDLNNIFSIDDSQVNIDTDRLKLWDVLDDNIINNTSTYVQYMEQIPIEIIEKIHDYVSIRSEKYYENRDIDHDNPEIIAVSMYLDLDDDLIDEIEEETFTHYGLNVYSHDGDNYCVGDSSGMEDVKREWAESYYDSVGVEGIVNIEKYIEINDVKYVASDLANSRVSDLNDYELIDECENYSEADTLCTRYYEIGETIETLETELDELSDNEDMDSEQYDVEEERIRDEISDLEDEKERLIDSMRETLEEVYTQEYVDRMGDDPIDWLWEMGWYSKKTGLDRTAITSGVVSINESKFIEDLEDDFTFDDVNGGNGYDEFDVDGTTYYVFKL
jgi:hypothetical protein